MYKAKRIFLTSVTILALAGFMLGGQSLAAIELVNEETGFSSDNEAIAESEIEFEFFNDNEEFVLNDAEAFSNTGGNEFEDAFDGDLESGEIDIEGVFENEFNLNEFDFFGGSFEDGLVGNEETGAFSDNQARADIEEGLELENDNDLDLKNDILVDANTGENIVEDSEDALLLTGDALLDAELENTANRNLVDAEGSLGIGSFDVFNEETGAFSDNFASLEFENEVEIENKNDADIENDIFVGLETGNNIIEDNCGDAEIETGDAEAEILISNDVNRNVLNLEFGEEDCDICPGGRSFDCDDCSFEFSCNGGDCDDCDECDDCDGCDSCGGDGFISVFNEETGFDSDNKAFAEIESELEIISENDADIDNDVVIELNTGLNEAEDNFGDAAVETGDAEAEVEIENIVNRNQVDVEWGFGSVIEVGNEETGCDSENEASVQIQDEVGIISENDADIDNSVDILLNTGANTAEDNGGCADAEIITGDAEAEVEIVNQVNSNITSVDLEGGLDIVAVNEETGECSDNSAIVEVEREIEIKSENNAQIENVISIVSNTGCNEGDDNVGDIGISSGSSSVSFGAINSGNLNTTDIAL